MCYHVYSLHRDKRGTPLLVCCVKKREDLVGQLRIADFTNSQWPQHILKSRQENYITERDEEEKKKLSGPHQSHGPYPWTKFHGPDQGDVLQHFHIRKNQSKVTEIENFFWEGNKHILVNKIAF